MSGGYFELLDWMVGRGKKVFVDLKFFDVPATVGAAVKQLRNRGVTLDHRARQPGDDGGGGAAKGDVKVLAVTVLTSLDRGDLDDLGFACDVEKLVLSRARRALEAGCDGVVSSGPRGAEAARIHRSPPAGGDAGHPSGREQAGGRPEAHRGRGAGVRERRRLHRGRPADPRCGRPARRGRGHPADHRRHLRQGGASERAAAERPAAARAAARADAAHAAVDDAPGRALPARVPRHARQGRQLPEPVHEPRAGLRGHAAAARALSGSTRRSCSRTSSRSRTRWTSASSSRRAKARRSRVPCAAPPTSTDCPCPIPRASCAT